MYVYCRVRLDEHDVRWVYNYHWDLCYMSRWELVCWWHCPTRCVHLLCWLLLWGWCRDCVRGYNGVVRDVYFGKLVRRGRGPTRRVHLLGRVLFACWCHHDMRGYVHIVYIVRIRQFVR